MSIAIGLFLSIGFAAGLYALGYVAIVAIVPASISPGDREEIDNS